jgi:hypothetical protein
MPSALTHNGDKGGGKSKGPLSFSELDLCGKLLETSVVSTGSRQEDKEEKEDKKQQQHPTCPLTWS